MFLIGLIAGLPAAAAAQSVEQFYRGRTVTLVVGTSPGGINDISSRLVARHLGRFIPGNPNIIVQNVPGGGGLVTANRIFNAAERDGSVLTKLERAVPQLAIQGNRNANFDPMKFTWLGSLSSYADDAYLLLVNAGQWRAHGRRSQAARRLGHRGRRQCGVEQPDLRPAGARGARAQREGGARLYRRGAGVSRHAERRAGRPDDRAELDPVGPARPVEPQGVPAAAAVRPQHAPRGAAPTYRPGASLRPIPTASP